MDKMYGLGQPRLPNETPLPRTEVRGPAINIVFSGPRSTPMPGLPKPDSEIFNARREDLEQMRVEVGSLSDSEDEFMSDALQGVQETAELLNNDPTAGMKQVDEAMSSLSLNPAATPNVSEHLGAAMSLLDLNPGPSPARIPTAPGKVTRKDPPNIKRQHREAKGHKFGSGRGRTRLIPLHLNLRSVTNGKTTVVIRPLNKAASGKSSSLRRFGRGD
ncbi:MAG: hypothetical protein SNF33_06130 [Candidatus Algichlamydia australiensis]|nr:hypothetical protein [Chlamydiales bacterium]